MQWTRLDKENGYCRLDIEASWAEVAADYLDLVAQYAKVRLPGFRPGKVPQGVIEQRFRKEIVEDVALRAVQRFGREAAREAGVEALGPLEAFEVECDKGKPLRARVRYLPLPEIRLPDLACLRGGDDGTDPLDRISRRLLELVPFELPADLVRRELALDDIAESDPGSSAWVAATERLRLMVILKRIARQEGLEVDERDVDKRIAEKAEEFGKSPKALRKELEEGSGMVRLREMLLAENTLEYLLETTRQGPEEGG